MTDDHDLVVAARSGSREAFRTLYERHRGAVVRLAEAFGGLDADEVDEVVQESFARAYTGMGALRVPAQFKPWLLAIARHRCLSYRHGQKLTDRVVEYLGRALPEAPPPAAQVMEREQERALVRELIQAMPEGAEKHTARLFYLEGELSVREIAESLGENKSTVAMRLERFRARFKQRYLARLEPSAQPGRKAGP